MGRHQSCWDISVDPAERALPAGRRAALLRIGIPPAAWALMESLPPL